MPALLRLVASLLGLACIGLAAVLFSSGTAFPGYAALLPAVGAVLVIAGGSRLLATAPLRYVGDRSYALYLWHWPVLMIAFEYSGHPLSTATKLLLVAGAFLLSIVSYGLFENPIRRMKWGGSRGLVLWPAAAAAVVAVALPILASIESKALQHRGGFRGGAPGSARRSGTARSARPDDARPRGGGRAGCAPRGPAAVSSHAGGGRSHARPLQLPEGLRADPGQTSSQICRMGVAGSGKTLVVLGDSHARMWMPAILKMALQDGWAVVPFVKPRCVPRTWYQAGNECSTWVRWATGHAASLHPYVSLIIGSWSGTASPGAAVTPVATLTKDDEALVRVGDRHGRRSHADEGPRRLPARAGANMKTCTATATRAQLKTDDTVAVGARKKKLGFISTRGWFCARGGSAILCPLVINRTIVWADRGHISQTYALELAGPFRAAFKHALFASP